MFNFLRRKQKPEHSYMDINAQPTYVRLDPPKETFVRRTEYPFRALFEASILKGDEPLRRNMDAIGGYLAERFKAEYGNRYKGVRLSRVSGGPRESDKKDFSLNPEKVWHVVDGILIIEDVEKVVSNPDAPPYVGEWRSGHIEMND